MSVDKITMEGNPGGMEIRGKILEWSLAIEQLTSLLLIGLLNISGGSTSFGNTSQALSFSQKLNLLIDIDALSPDAKSKFVTFMEIRNQFMHNYAASSFTNCIKSLNGKEGYLLKNYPQDKSLEIESQLSLAVRGLCQDVLNLTVQISEPLFQRINDRKLLDKLKTAMQEIKN